MLLWEAFRVARTWHCRPSELFAIEDAWEAFSLDRAVALFGNALQSELDSVKGKNEKEIERNRAAVLDRWLPELKDHKVQRYADPARR